MMKTIAPSTIDETIQAVNSHDSVLPVGNRSKPALSCPGDESQLVSTRNLSGIIEYEPTEFTFTAYAGTLLKEIEGALKPNRQSLPFDPPFIDQKATLAGAIASGLNGSCSLRFGGARDFVLGIRFIDGQGNHVTSGGKVVKNAAGFDLPKYFVGSCGRFGLLTELTIKVFPYPVEYQSLVFSGNLDQQLEAVEQLHQTPLELYALDIFEDKLFVRIGGTSSSFAALRNRIEKLVGKKAIAVMNDPLEEFLFWREANSFAWADLPNSFLIKVPCQFDDLEKLMGVAIDRTERHRVSLGGQVFYLSVSDDQYLPTIKKLQENGFESQLIAGPSAACLPFGLSPFSQKVKTALDPKNKFPMGSV